MTLLLVANVADKSCNEVLLGIVQQPSEVQIPWLAWCAKRDSGDRFYERGHRIGYVQLFRRRFWCGMSQDNRHLTICQQWLTRPRNQ